ncbi:Dyp-type peroxidase [Paeniglutamicibacter kerguelensis]|uniref:Dye decolorizing peroxidase n=1 Tax=Paeniglutamicibacter kerguelensis TaxID=254788 RepID=A0ABS4XFI9_9MICC|nr:dye decolorizing peroxidase [Paeniglutamicibacter kerguelensis]
MTTTANQPSVHSRRALLLGGAATVAGAAAGFAAGSGGGTARAAATQPGDPMHGRETIAFHGDRQPGIQTPAPAFVSFLALDLILPDASNEIEQREILRRVFRLISDDAARLMDGRGILADTEPELAANPARLTVTVGLGPLALKTMNPGLLPSWLRELETFPGDTLDPAWGQSDLVLQICGDDRMSLAHASRAMLKDLRPLARLHWVQDGFRHSRGSQDEAATMRNLFGQLDGTGNPSGERLERALWGGENLEPWVPGGTSLVLRRIEMDLDAWDRVDRPGRDFSLGRRQDTGAPLTGSHEFDSPDLRATDELGLPVISPDSHVARSQPREADEIILRRGYNYLEPGSAGLLFASYQCDPGRQFLPIQRRLATADMLNEWTTAIGSAVYAVLPGCAEGSYLGKELFAG